MTHNPFQKFTNKIKDMAKDVPHLDKEAIINSHKKNMEAVTEASKMAMDVMKSIISLQGRYVEQTFQDISSIVRATLAHPKPSKEDMEQQSLQMKEQVEKAFEHGATISTTLTNSQREIFNVMHSRYQESVGESFDFKEQEVSKTKH